MFQRNCWVFLLTLGCTIPSRISMKSLRFTNIKCQEFDPTFATVETCNLKVLQRGIIGMNIRVKLYQMPVTNVSINLAMYKRQNGYHPFFYNITLDFCDFMRRPSKYIIFRMFYNGYADSSNANHTCPYNHDIIIEHLVLKENTFNLVPLPDGDYKLKLMVGAYNDWKVGIQMFFAYKN